MKQQLSCALFSPVLTDMRGGATSVLPASSEVAAVLQSRLDTHNLAGLVGIIVTIDRVMTHIPAPHRSILRVAVPFSLLPASTI